MKMNDVIERMKGAAWHIAQQSGDGALHIFVADGNCTDEDIEFCREQPNLTVGEREFLEAMMAMREEERFGAWALARCEDCAAEWKGWPTPLDPAGDDLSVWRVSYSGEKGWDGAAFVEAQGLWMAEGALQKYGLNRPDVPARLSRLPLGSVKPEYMNRLLTSQEELDAAAA